jgi:hypothetical protein
MTAHPNRRKLVDQGGRGRGGGRANSRILA